MRRREFLCGIAFMAASGFGSRVDRLALDVIESPSNLGLRPDSTGKLAGTWRAPKALLDAGIAQGFSVRKNISLARPEYHREPEAGTSIRNGQTLRTYSLSLASAVRHSLRSAGFPLVVGGDCSNILGCLYGLRGAGGRGIIYLDGHSDFFHPGNYDVNSRLGSAAGMDLALATGRGESVLTKWPNITSPLVSDGDVLQVGERDRDEPDYPFHEIVSGAIYQITAQEAQALGIDKVASKVEARMASRGIQRAWLHVDADVLDERFMPAVDSPGTPGFSFEELTTLVGSLLQSGRIAGMDVAIYDPDLDASGQYGTSLSRAINLALSNL